ncbi:hypothetical protein BU17DRAFT_64637 [Hysterangium stoloniferum]|nr:hypothetical protein BU17DRAFT_64637 [Hysterangium stoloniferum]
MFSRASRNAIRGVKLGQIRTRYQSTTGGTASVSKSPKPNYDAFYGALAGSGGRGIHVVSPLRGKDGGTDGEDCNRHSPASPGKINQVTVSGLEAKRIATNTANQAASILNNAVNATSITEVTVLLETKSKEIQDLANRSSSTAWEATINSAQPILAHLPYLKNLLDKNAENLKGNVGEEPVKIVKELCTESISESDKSPEEMEDDAEKVVKEKTNELREQGGAGGGPEVPDGADDKD